MNRSSAIPSSKSKRAGVLLVDDHPLVRERLTEILNREPDLKVIAEAEDRSSALAAIRRESPDLVIVDLALKGSDGLELIKDIHAAWPRVNVLVVSMHDESLYAERVIRAGARGYITKQEATRKILMAIRRILDGGVYLNEKASSGILSRLAGGRDAGSSASVESLADRELQVFELIGYGLNTHQIAQRLHIGSKTVETYRARIREKLDLRDSSELLQLAISWAHQR